MAAEGVCGENGTGVLHPRIFFQLLGAKILGFEWANNTKSINYVLLKGDSGIYNYNTLSFWSGFEFRSQRHGAKGQLYAALKDNSVFQSYFKSRR